MQMASTWASRRETLGVCACTKDTSTAKHTESEENKLRDGATLHLQQSGVVLHELMLTNMIMIDADENSSACGVSQYQITQ